MLFYHASDRDIQWPDPLVLKQVCREWPVIPAFFANTIGYALTKGYGKNLYSFNLKEDTQFCTMSHKMYCGIKNNNQYKSGMFDTGKRAGVDAFIRHHSGDNDTSLIVLNFDKIQNWKLTNLKE